MIEWNGCEILRGTNKKKIEKKIEMIRNKWKDEKKRGKVIGICK